MTEQLADIAEESPLRDSALPTDHVTRALTIVLSDADWQALRRVEPDPVNWLRAQVHERLDRAVNTATPVAPAD